MICLIVWYIIGVWGFVYWWTTIYDLELKEVALALIYGSLGIFSWVIGYFMFSNKKIIIIKKKGV